MKKKFTVVLLTFLMSILCVLGLAACKNNDGTGDDGCEHSWGEWENTKEASCSEEGNRVHVCEKCGKSENETIEKIDHDFNSENICTVCGYELEITVGLEYEEYEEQVYCVKSMGYATDRDIVIPAYYMGKPVKKVAAEAFSGKDAIQSVYIAGGITEIEDKAFYYCSSMKKVTLPQSIEIIGNEAFSNCTMLTTVKLPDKGLTIGNKAFYGISAYREKNNWKDGVLYLGNHLIVANETFKSESYTIAENVKSIAAHAFANQSALKEIIINSVSPIVGENAFANTNLSKATVAYNLINILPNDNINDLTIISGKVVSLTEFPNLKKVAIVKDGEREYGALSGLGKLEELILQKAPSRLGSCFGEKEYAGSILINQPYAWGSDDYYIPQSLHKVTILEGSVWKYDFQNCSMLTDICLGEGVTDISSMKITGCTNLQSINYEGSLEKFCGVSKRSFGEIRVKLQGKELQGKITIPQGVETIADGAFQDQTLITGFSIPDSVTSIGINAFNGTGYYNNENNWEDGVLYVGKHLIKISDSVSLENFTIKEDCLTIASQVFSGRSDLTSIELPNTLTGIGAGAFKGCSGLTGIIIPDSVIRVGDEAFYDCSGMTNVSIGSKVENIGISAFYNCISLTNIMIPESVKNIGTSAFSRCNELTVVDWNATECLKIASDDGAIFAQCNNLITVHFGQNVKTIPAGAFRGCSELTSVTIPDSVTSIGDSVFSGCSGLISVTIGNSVANIGEDAFSACEGLMSMIIPDSVMSIGAHAFDGCRGLTSVTMGNGITTIENHLFSYCTKLESIIIPDSVTNIGEFAFYGCNELSSVQIGDGVTKIDYMAFHGLSNLQNVELGNGLVTFENHVFSDCTSLKSIVIPDSVTDLGGATFRGCSALTDVTIGKGVKEIGGEVFRWCSGLTNIIIPDNVTLIGYTAFEECTNLIKVVIPDSVTSIGKGAFRDCSALTSVQIGKNVESIGYMAFGACILLNEITIPENITTIGSHAFSDCSNLLKVNWNAISCSMAGDHYNTVFKGSNQIQTVNIGENVTMIPDATFSGCAQLTSITIPDRVECIGEYAFYECSSLTEVVIGNAISYIGDYAFYNCTITNKNQYDNCFYLGNKNNRYVVLLETIDKNITSCNIHPQTRVIYEWAFTDCDIKSIEIPNGVKHIGQYAFRSCEELNSVTIPSSVKSIGCDAFISFCAPKIITYEGNIQNWCEIEGLQYLMGSGVSLTIGGQEIAGELVIPDGVTNIVNGAFSGCNGLTRVILPKSVTSIGAYAFRNCSGLTSIVIPNSVKSIGREAFSGCSGLTNVVIPDSVTSIYYSAFSRCSGLTNVTFQNTSGWWISQSYDATSGTTISSNDLMNSLTSANYLTNTYQYYYWRRS